jgi:hypothetical protein
VYHPRYVQLYPYLTGGMKEGESEGVRDMWTTTVCFIFLTQSVSVRLVSICLSVVYHSISLFTILCGSHDGAPLYISCPVYIDI